MRPKVLLLEKSKRMGGPADGIHIKCFVQIINLSVDVNKITNKNGPSPTSD